MRTTRLRIVENSLHHLLGRPRNNTGVLEREPGKALSHYSGETVVSDRENKASGDNV